MTEETKVGTTETLPVSEAKTEKVEKDVSYREILKTLDVEDEEKKFLQEQYKAQLSSKVAENEIKALKKDFYNQVTESRAGKRAETMFKEKLNKEEELLKEKGYKPLETEEVKTLLDGKIFNVTTHKDLFDKAKSNPVLASMIREAHSSFAEKMLASENNISDSKNDNKEMNDNDKKLFRELDAIRLKGFKNNTQRDDYSRLLEKMMKNKINNQ